MWYTSQVEDPKVTSCFCVTAEIVSDMEQQSKSWQGTKCYNGLTKTLRLVIYDVQQREIDEVCNRINEIEDSVDDGVEEFVETFKWDGKEKKKDLVVVPKLRNIIPLLMMICYYPSSSGSNPVKVKGIWSEDNKPSDWPSNVEFVDPNNYDKKKKTKKPGQMVLMRMAKHLVEKYRVKQQLTPMVVSQLQERIEQKLEALKKKQRQSVDILFTHFDELLKAPKDCKLITQLHVIESFVDVVGHTGSAVTHLEQKLASLMGETRRIMLSDSVVHAREVVCQQATDQDHQPNGQLSEQLISEAPFEFCNNFLSHGDNVPGMNDDADACAVSSSLQKCTIASSLAYVEQPNANYDDSAQPGDVQEVDNDAPFAADLGAVTRQDSRTVQNVQLDTDGDQNANGILLLEVDMNNTNSSLSSGSDVASEGNLTVRTEIAEMCIEMDSVSRTDDSVATPCTRSMQQRSNGDQFDTTRNAAAVQGGRADQNDAEVGDDWDDILELAGTDCEGFEKTLREEGEGCLLDAAYVCETDLPSYPVSNSADNNTCRDSAVEQPSTQLVEANSSGSLVNKGKKVKSRRSGSFSAADPPTKKVRSSKEAMQIDPENVPL